MNFQLIASSTSWQSKNVHDTKATGAGRIQFSELTNRAHEAVCSVFTYNFRTEV